MTLKNNITLIGVATVAVASHIALSSFFEKKDLLTHDQNPLGVFGSAYGKTISAAMQGPIHLMWHDGRKHSHGKDGDHTHHDDSDAHSSCEVCDCGGETHHADEIAATGEETVSPKSRKPFSYSGWVKRINEMRYERTNPYQKTELHERFVRGLIEEKVEFAWRMDPSNYDNYQIYHFFLTETAVAKTSRNYRKAFEVAQKTVAFCDQHPEDPIANLTAVAASQAIVDIALNFERDEIHLASLTAANRAAVDYLKRHQEQLEIAYQQNLVSDSAYIEMTGASRILSKVQEANQVALNRWATAQN